MCAQSGVHHCLNILKPFFRHKHHAHTAVKSKRVKTTFQNVEPPVRTKIGTDRFVVFIYWQGEGLRPFAVRRPKIHQRF